MGFLQRLAIAQVVVSAVYIYFPLIRIRKKQQSLVNKANRNYFCRVAIFAVFPIINLILTVLVKDPRCPDRYTGPGLFNTTTNQNQTMCAGGANRYIDELIMGYDRLPTNPKCRFFYGCDRFDEDGILGTLNFIFGVALGSMAGSFLLRKIHKVFQISRRFMIHIVISLMTGMIFGGIISYRLFGPFNVNSQLWSFSFVCVANAASVFIFTLIGALYLKGVWTGWPFRAVGKNAIFILVVQRLMASRFPFGYWHNGNHFDATLSSLITCTVWIALAITLNYYKFYVKY